jgi:hypothetical protein
MSPAEQRRGEQDAPEAERANAQGEPPPLPAWSKHTVRLLDDLIPIPGAKRGVGLDPIVGLLVPGGGDAIMAVSSVTILVLGIRRGVPKPVLFRMIANLGLDALVGVVPVLGDLFDVAFRANRRNLELVEKHQRYGKPAGASDYAVLTVGLLVVVASVALPIAVAVYLGSMLFGR